MFSDDNPEVQIPALRCLINIVSGCDAQTQAVIDANLLTYLHSLLLHPPNDTVRKEACLIVSNITAGTVEQVQAVMDHGLIPTLVDILRYADFRTKREACWALGNSMLCREPQQIQYILSTGMLPPLLDLIHPENFSIIGHDERVLLKTLEAIKNILSGGDVEAERMAAEETAGEQDMVDNALLGQFERMKIFQAQKERQDSAYGSATNLFPEGAPSTSFMSKPSNSSYQNPFLKYFTEPLLTSAISALPEDAYQNTDWQATGKERVQRLCRAIHSSLRGYVPSREVMELAQEIDHRWFS